MIKNTYSSPSAETIGFSSTDIISTSFEYKSEGAGESLFWDDIIK